MKYIKGYDGLRAFSIILVVLTHLGIGDNLAPGFVRDRLFLLFSGLTGVQVFFSLSGFLITGILLRERDKAGTINLKNFYIRRFIRLLPPLLVFFVMAGLAMFVFNAIARSSVGMLMAITYTYNFIPARFYTSEVGHMWSLAVEEQFYLLWPLLLCFIPGSRKLYYIIAAMVVACIIAVFTLGDIPVGDKTLGDMFLVGRWFIPAVGPIMIGSGFAVFVHYNKELLAASVKDNKVVVLIALILYASPLWLPKSILIMNAIPVSFGVSIFLMWVYFNQESKLTGILQTQPLVYIGKISYGIYVYQGFFLGTGPEENAISIRQFPLNIILTIIVAIASYELFEKKILKLKDRFK